MTLTADDSMHIPIHDINFGWHSHTDMEQNWQKAGG